MAPEKSPVFQQDEAPICTRHLVLLALSDNFGAITFGPDLKPLGYFWSGIKQNKAHLNVVSQTAELTRCS